MLAKEIERTGIPTAQICTILPIAQTVGANRIIKAVAIPYPVGSPGKTEREEKEIRESIVRKALRSLTLSVNTQLVIQ